MLLPLLLILAAAATQAATGSPPADDALRRKLYMLLYCLPGLPVVHRYVRQGFDPSDDDDDRDTVKWATCLLAPLWPVLLLALLANRDSKKK